MNACSSLRSLLCLLERNTALQDKIQGNLGDFDAQKDFRLKVAILFQTVHSANSVRFLLSRKFSPRVPPEPLRVPLFGNRWFRGNGPPLYLCLFSPHSPKIPFTLTHTYTHTHTHTHTHTWVLESVASTSLKVWGCEAGGHTHTHTHTHHTHTHTHTHIHTHTTHTHTHTPPHDRERTPL